MSIYTNPIINDTICSIYVITCLINNKKYIGFTKRSIEVRWHEHIRYSKTDNNSALYRAMRKHGINNFSIQAIYQSKNIEHTHTVMEPYFITEYETHVRCNQGYNSVEGGIGCTNPSAKTRYRMGNANRGKKREISDQVRLSFTKHRGEFISPDGKIIAVNNFEKFARDNNLTVRMLVRVNNGVMENHRGWRSSNYKVTTKKTFHPIRKYSITSPDGTEYVIDNYNLSGFCKFYSLGLSAIYKLINKKIKSHHGWTLSNNSFSTNT